MGTQAPTQQDSYDRAERQVPPLPPPPPIDIEAQEAAAHEPVVLPPQPPAPLPIDTAAPEAEAEAAAAAAQPVLIGLEVDNVKMDSWAKIIVNFCLSTAVAVALSSSQLQPSPITSLHIFFFIITLSFASLFVSHFIQSRFLVIARVLYGVGIFFAVTAFFIAITIHFPLYLKLITWLIYAFCLLVIFVSKFFPNNNAI